MHRLLVTTELLKQHAVVLPKDAAHHLKVVRPKLGEQIELFDGCGSTRVYQYVGDSLQALAERKSFARAAHSLTLFACVTKGSRWDWTIEKAVELGVTRIVPVISDRCIVRLSVPERVSKAERWRRVAEDAARQSDAIWLPEVLPAVDFPQSLDLVKACDCVFVGALTQPAPPPLLVAVQKVMDAARAGSTPAVKSFGLFVGPEGDFSPAELASLLACAHATSFGPTILRAETAAIFGLSVLSSALAQRDPPNEMPL